MEFNLADLFESVVDAVGEREALVAGDVRLTYAGLDQEANRLAHHLAARGVVPGAHVGVHLHNGAEYVVTMLACFKIRAVPVNVNYRYVEEELRYLYADADLVATVFDGAYAGRLSAIVPQLPKLSHFVMVGAAEGAVPEGAVSWADALAAGSPERGFPARSAGDLYIIYTGGTTGMPKGVMWRHEDLFFAGLNGGSLTGDPARRPEDVAAGIGDAGTMFPVAPLMHGAAQLATFLALHEGWKTVLLPKFDPREVWRLASRERAVIMAIVGDAMARPMAEELEANPGAYDLSALKNLRSAGAILSQGVRELLQAHLPGTVVSDAFGSSETGFNGRATQDSSPDKGLRFTMSDRTAVVDDELRIVQPGSDVVGRVAQTKHVPLGYYNDPEKTAATFVEIDGSRWVLLGDRARVEADGTIVVLGRGSVCINSGGEKIYPEEVEAVLKSHPAVFDAVVAGMPDERFGERVAAVLQARPGVPAPDLDELQAWCADKLARYKVPRFVTQVDQMRRSPSGKPDYRWAKETVAKASAAAS